MAGIRGKDEEFWERSKMWDVIDLVETWLEVKDWEKMKRKIPMELNWTLQRARNERKKEKAAEGC